MKKRTINRPYLSIPITLDEVLGSLTNTQAVPSSIHLAELSDLPPDSLCLLKTAWQKLDAPRRHEIISRLKDLAEENVELNFDGVFQLGLEDKDPLVRKSSINGLWENCQGWLQCALSGLAREDPSEEVRIASVQALERFCLDAELNNKEEDKTQLADLLLSIFNNRSESDELRRRALEAASPLDHTEVCHAIDSAFQSENRNLKVSAIYAMGASSNPSWFPVLILQLENSDAELRYEATRACGEIGGEEAASELISLFEDDDRDVQLAAVQALGKIGGRQSREALLNLLDSQDELLRDTARQSLHELELYNDPFSPSSLEFDEDDE